MTNAGGKAWPVETPTLTPEQQAVIDAAINWRKQPDSPGALLRLMHEVDALEASKADQ